MKGSNNKIIDYFQNLKKLMMNLKTNIRQCLFGTSERGHPII